MAEVEVHFTRAVAHAQRLTPTLSEADQLRLYGLYKQATAGKCPEWPTTTPARRAGGHCSPEHPFRQSTLRSVDSQKSKRGGETAVTARRG